MSKLYRQTELTDEEMDDYVFPHVMAMAGEKLHFKHEIAKELGSRDKKIKELEQALDDTNKELCVAREEVNNHLAEGVTSSTENEPDYWVFQTVHDNQVLLSKTQQPEVK